MNLQTLLQKLKSIPVVGKVLEDPTLALTYVTSNWPALAVGAVCGFVLGRLV